MTKGTFGQLTCEWQYLFEEFTKDPMIVENRRLRIEAKVQKILGLKFKWEATFSHEENQTVVNQITRFKLIISYIFLYIKGESKVCLPCQGVWEDH